jgi:hypothetical protein
VDQRALQDSAVKKEGADCQGFRVNLALKVKEALLARPALQGKMGRTALRAPPVKTVFLERTAKTDCQAKTEQMAKMAWMESMDNPGGQAKSARLEIPVLLVVSACMHCQFDEHIPLFFSRTSATALLLTCPQCLVLGALVATMGTRVPEVEGAFPVLRACRDPSAQQAPRVSLATRHKHRRLWREHPPDCMRDGTL